MATVTERLAAEIASQQSEVDRMTAVATVDLPAAVAKLDALKALAGEVTPEFERIAAKLETVQIAAPINMDPVKPPKPKTRAKR